jgi:hypothetical protein
MMSESEALTKRFTKGNVLFSGYRDAHNLLDTLYVIKFLHTKKFNFSAIVAELAPAYGEQTYAKKAVEY